MNREQVPITTEFTTTALVDSTGRRITVCRLGFSSSYRPGRKAVYEAVERGMNLFFCFGFDRQAIDVLREVTRGKRERFFIVTGAYNLLWGYPNLRRTLEKRLRQLRTEYLDAFLFLGVTKGKQFDARAQEELLRLREEGRTRFIGVSSHDRAFAGRLAAEGAANFLMVRYNAAHRGAEQDVFPFVRKERTALVAYTATRWTGLLRRPRGWPRDELVPSAGMCYRFVLSNPHVDACLTAPRSLRELEENFAAVQNGPLNDDEMNMMRRFGDVVYRESRSFFSVADLQQRRRRRQESVHHQHDTQHPSR